MINKIISEMVSLFKRDQAAERYTIDSEDYYVKYIVVEMFCFLTLTIEYIDIYRSDGSSIKLDLYTRWKIIDSFEKIVNAES